MLVSDPILAELDAVTARPDVVRKLRVTLRKARAPLVRIRSEAVVVRPGIAIRGDDDLLVLGEVEGIPLVDIPTFWQRLVEHREHT